MRRSHWYLVLVVTGVTGVICAAVTDPRDGIPTSREAEPESVRQYREVEAYLTARSSPTRTYELLPREDSPAGIAARAESEMERQREAQWLHNRGAALARFASDYVNYVTTRQWHRQPSPVTEFQLFRALRTVDRDLAERMERDLLQSVHFALVAVEPAYHKDRARLAEILGPEAMRIISFQRGLRVSLLRRATDRRDPCFIQGAMESVEYEDASVTYLLAHVDTRSEIAEFLLAKHRDSSSRLSNDPSLEQRVEELRGAGPARGSGKRDISE
jgi:hypothetical protein